nr:hypothetical protein [uncultured Mediterranean phage uvMED]|tara:strand:+ start:277 stop:531 length:255 start_codon:yes stop_codon:yes gene_type:complete
MSTVNYKILAFDDISLEYVISANDKRFNVAAVVVDNLVDKEETTKAIEAEVKSAFAIRTPPSPPTNYVDLVGAGSSVDLSAEEV